MKTKKSFGYPESNPGLLALAENTNAENTNAGNTNAGNTNAGNTNAEEASAKR